MAAGEGFRSIDDVVRTFRRASQQELRKLPALYALLGRLQRAAEPGAAGGAGGAGGGGPPLARDAAEARLLRERIAMVERRIRGIESGERERALEERVRPYVIRYAAAMEERSRRKRQTELSRTRYAPLMPCETIEDAGPLLARPAATGAPAARDVTLEQVMLSAARELRLAPRRVTVVAHDNCDRCGEIMLLHTIEPLLVCPKCGEKKRYADTTSNAMAYNEDLEYAKFSYRPVGHLNDTLNYIQAKERTVVPYDVLRRIMEEMYRKGLRPEDITHTRIDEIVRSLKLKKYYDNVPQITSRLSGIAPRRMTPAQEEQFRLMFRAAEPFFYKHRESRINHLQYQYSIWRYSHTLGYDEFKKPLHMLKGRDKIRKHDAIYEKIAREVDWDFSPMMR